MSSFAHDLNGDTTTLSELVRIYELVEPDNFFGCYAYARLSGFRAFELAFGKDFWATTSTRWLFGIDYGRTDPRALREMAKCQNADVRIYDGAWLVEQEGFSPRRDFHAKVALMANTNAKKSGAVLGSGNFSYNGLRKSIEAGATLFTKSEQKFQKRISPTQDIFEKLWQTSTPLADILDQYEQIKEKLVSESDQKKPKGAPNPKRFWIEAGYVTKNRGDDKPGNQIFFPPGFRSFFGFKGKKKIEKNAIIGKITFKTKIGEPVTNNLRLNANGMEKISLPMPETHGFGVYDGKILVFERIGQDFLMKVFESIEFETMFADNLVDVKKMNGGRRYGAIG